MTENIYTWSYGRSYLYTLGPYYHMGLRMTKPLTKTFTAGLQIVNGWNNVEDNNTGKTVGFTTAWTGKKAAWNNNIYIGPEKNATNVGYRQFYDTVVSLTPNDTFNAWINYDHGHESQANGKKTPNADWDIFGIAGKFQLNTPNALSFRYEYVGDHDGFATGYGSKINIQEITATYEYKWMKGLLTRLEYRHDWSDKGFFEHGNQGQPLNPGIGIFTPGPKKHQDTLTVGFVAFFGPK